MPSLLRSADTANASARSFDRMSVLPAPERLVVHPGGSDSEKPAAVLITRVQPRGGAAGASAVSFAAGSGAWEEDEDEPPHPAGAAARTRQTRRGRHCTSAPSWIRTSGLLLRRESLYPV
jgi:hypothetical protein